MAVSTSHLYVQISTGWKHSAAVGHAGELYCWGWGGSVGTATSLETGQSSGGQLGLGNEFDYWAPTLVSDLQMSESGALQSEAQEPVLAARWKALEVSCGFNHTAAVIEVKDVQQ